MRRALPLLVVALAAAACSTVDGPERGALAAEATDADASSPTTGTGSDAAGTEETGTEETGTEEREPEGLAAVDELLRLEPEPARALITPTGVVLPVVEDRDDGYLVLTPCGVEVEMAWGTPIATAEVALDAGHGGDVETGAQGPNGLVEKDLNLRLAKRTATELRARGISVVLTRTADYRIPLSTRAAIANQLETELLVSIHHNAPIVGSSIGPGSEVFIQQGSEESRRLGGLIYEEIVGALAQFDDVYWVAARDAGVLAVLNNDEEDSYGMIRRPNMPAVLAEFGYLANPSEADLFASDEYVEVAGLALADAIERWLDTDDPGSGFVDEPRRFTPDGSTGHSRGCEDPPLE